MSPRRREPPDAVLLDEMFSPVIAELLVARGVDCEAVAARPTLRSRDDLEVLEAALSGSYTATLTETDSAGTSTSKVFTGQTMSCNGGAGAQTTRTFLII